MLEFGTKADTLAALSGKLKHATVLPLIQHTYQEWKSDGLELFAKDKLPEWFSGPLIVRSSAVDEDGNNTTQAGHYLSVCLDNADEQLDSSINSVIESFSCENPKNQFFIQPRLTNVSVSGVAFSKDPNNGAPYFVINYDNTSGSVNTVTSGCTNELIVYYQAKFYKKKIDGWLGNLIHLLNELEDVFKCDELDVEFAVDENDKLVLLQVRRLPINNVSISQDEHEAVLTRISNKIETLTKPHPYLLGDRSVFGVMPDWNPAEIIGIRPRPLALSLYKELVTDNIWAYQRDNYGYRNLRSFPLLVSFGGQPYIDTRISFNSFIPSTIEPKLASKLINYYTEQLINTPSHHDKVEFEIIFSCYTFDLFERMDRLKEEGFSESECSKLTEHLHSLTNSIIHGDKGLWKLDRHKIDELIKRQSLIYNSDLGHVEKAYWLIEDCKRYGTLPFAGLARAAFIAVQLLKSLVAVNAITNTHYENFMGSLETVSTFLSRDMVDLTPQDFMDKYGHLRPGTYDVLSPRYDEDPDYYFSWEDIKKSYEEKTKDVQFEMNLDVLNGISSLLQEHSIEHDVISLFDFIKSAIEGREYAKFVFTRSLSNAIKILKEYGDSYGVETDDLSYMDFNVIKHIYSSACDPAEVMKNSIDGGKRNYRLTNQIVLPPVISESSEVFSFEVPGGKPNFITMNSIEAEVAYELSKHSNLEYKILMIMNADPGFDWVFSKGIKGLITMYGGANSHMAIRAMELGLPSVIGAGQVLFNQWVKAKILHIDCANEQVKVIQ